MSPKLTASLKWFRAETLRSLAVKADDARIACSTRMQAFYLAKAAKVRTQPLVALKAAYLAERVRDIMSAPLTELRLACRARLHGLDGGDNRELAARGSADLVGIYFRLRNEGAGEIVRLSAR